MRCTLKQLNEELKYKKPSEQVFFVSDSAEEIENFCEKMIKKEPEYIAAKIGYKAAFCSMTAERADKPPREITKVLTERGNEQNAAYAGIPHSFILQPLSGFSYQEESVDDGEGRFNGYARLSFRLAYARKARRKNEVSFYSKS